jgi:hypothetical protein
MARVLPDEFEAMHQQAFEWHDLLAQYVVEGERQAVLFVRAELRDPNHAEIIDGLSGEAGVDWMEANGYADLVEEHVFRHLVIALLSDFCHFIYESLRCSEKGKLTVAYALLRKPMRDNLVYLEWMLADRPDFMSRFREGGNKIDATKLSPARRLANTQAAMAKCRCGTWLEPEFFDELRFAKDSNFGFEPTWNKALHLVTTREGYATEPYNLNFIFSDDACRHSQWDGLYPFLIALLVHAWQVVESLFASFAPEFVVEGPIASLRRLAGFVLIRPQSEDDEISEFMRDLFDSCKVPCPDCASLLTGFVTRDDLEEFYRFGTVRCARCQTRTALVPTPDDEVTANDDDDGGATELFEAWADGMGLSEEERSDVVFQAFLAGQSMQQQ